MEALDYIIAVRRWRKLPWLVGASTLTPDRRASPDSRGRHVPEEQPAPGLLAYTIAGVLRVVLGGGTAAAVAHTAPSATAWVAVVAGAAAPMVLERITLLVPLLIHMGREGVVAALQPSTPRQGRHLDPSRRLRHCMGLRQLVSPPRLMRPPVQ